VPRYDGFIKRHLRIVAFVRRRIGIDQFQESVEAAVNAGGMELDENNYESEKGKCNSVIDDFDTLAGNPKAKEKKGEGKPAAAGVTPSKLMQALFSVKFRKLDLGKGFLLIEGQFFDRIFQLCWHRTAPVGAVWVPKTTQNRADLPKVLGR
jgi:hypothetical protein